MANLNVKQFTSAAGKLSKAASSLSDNLGGYEEVKVPSTPKEMEKVKKQLEKTSDKITKLRETMDAVNVMLTEAAPESDN